MTLLDLYLIASPPAFILVLYLMFRNYDTRVTVGTFIPLAIMLCIPAINIILLIVLVLTTVPINIFEKTNLSEKVITITRANIKIGIDFFRIMVYNININKHY